MIKSIQFTNVKDDFQTKIKNNISKIKSSPNAFLFAKMAKNLYEMLPNDYKKLLYENTTKMYKKSADCLEHTMNMEAKHIAKNIKLYDRNEKLAKIPVFVTLKDHTENFTSGHPSGLINLSKTSWEKSIKLYPGITICSIYLKVYLMSYILESRKKVYDIKDFALY